MYDARLTAAQSPGNSPPTSSASSHFQQTAFLVGDKEVEQDNGLDVVR